MMKLYTKTGDDGSTGLFGGARVGKNDPRVHAYGDVDEANAAIGVAVTLSNHQPTLDMLRRIQSDLFVIGGELATPDDRRSTVAVTDEDIARLERWIDEAVKDPPPLQQFVLPGGTPEAAALHVARTVCRRAERAVVSLGSGQHVSPTLLVYLNRLSDLLFALSRLANHRNRMPDVVWSAPPAQSRTQG